MCPAGVNRPRISGLLFAHSPAELINYFNPIIPPAYRRWIDRARWIDRVLWLSQPSWVIKGVSEVVRKPRLESSLTDSLRRLLGSSTGEPALPPGRVGQGTCRTGVNDGIMAPEDRGENNTCYPLRKSNSPCSTPIVRVLPHTHRSLVCPPPTFLLVTMVTPPPLCSAQQQAAVARPESAHRALPSLTAEENSRALRHTRACRGGRAPWRFSGGLKKEGLPLPPV